MVGTRGGDGSEAKREWVGSEEGMGRKETGITAGRKLYLTSPKRKKTVPQNRQGGNGFFLLVCLLYFGSFADIFCSTDTVYGLNKPVSCV